MVNYLTTKEVAEATKTSAGFWHQLRCNGNGPTFTKLGAAVRYRLEDIEGWLAEREFSNASEAKHTHREEAK